MAAELSRRGFTFDALRADLELVDRSLEEHLVRKAGAGFAGLLFPAAFVALVTAAGLQFPVAVPALFGLVLAAVCFVLPDLTLAARADRRRAELRRALSCYLDLVSMSLAGGRGIPEALPTAARIGHGWAFETLQQTIEHAGYVGDTPWEGLAALGKRTGTTELEDLAGAVALVATDGAKVRASLTARASTQRRRQLAEAEGEAQKADQTIAIAQVMLAAGFFVFLIYPAVTLILAA